MRAVFRLVTAFTHPRRVEIFRALRAGPASPGQLQFVTRISSRALLRHLAKLKARGFVKPRQGLYSIVQPTDALRRGLARLAGL